MKWALCGDKEGGSYRSGLSGEERSIDFLVWRMVIKHLGPGDLDMEPRSLRAADVN